MGGSLFLIKRRCNVYLVPNETAKILSTNQKFTIKFLRFYGNTRFLFSSFPTYLNTIVQILSIAHILSS